MTEPTSEPDVAKAPAPAAKRRLAKLSTAKPPEPPPPPPLAVRVLRSPVLATMVWPLMLAIGGWIVWQQWGAERVGAQYYRLNPTNVSVTPPPAYIRSDIVGEVFKTHQLEKTSLLNQLAAAVIGEAFQTHPWVSDVLRVEKRSDGVDIQLRYRRPIAMVRVQSEHPAVPGEALFVIDANSILLPTADFSISDGRKYFHIEIEGTYPKAGIGSAYGDARVAAAARLAALLEPHRESLELAAIQLTNPRLLNPRPTFNEAWAFAVIRRDGTQFLWGSAPGDELEIEATAQEKLAALLADPRGVRDLRGL